MDEIAKEYKTDTQIANEILDLTYYELYGDHTQEGYDNAFFITARYDLPIDSIPRIWQSNSDLERFFKHYVYAIINAEDYSEALTQEIVQEDIVNSTMYQVLTQKSDHALKKYLFELSMFGKELS